jgi:chromodomain-helicase-DNA-binding protein 1
MLPSYPIVKDTPEFNISEGASDSDYGAPSRKKKRLAAPNDDLRFSSRGNRVPNYAENDDDEEDASGDDDDMMDIDGVAHISAGPEEEVHEIEGVFDHHRDEERKKDSQDDFYSNIVRQSRLTPSSRS